MSAPLGALRDWRALHPADKKANVRLTLLATSEYAPRLPPDTRDVRVRKTAAVLRALQIYDGLVSFERATGAVMRLLILQMDKNLLAATQLDRDPGEHRPFSLGQPRPELPPDRYDMNQAQMLGEGAFGCVIRADFRQGNNAGRPVALKLQVLKPGAITAGAEEAIAREFGINAESYALQRATYLKRFLITNPFSVGVFDMYVVEFSAEVVKALAPFRAECKVLKLPKNPVPAKRLLLHVIETEFVAGGDLLEPEVENLSAEQLQSMAFQLLYSLIALFRGFKMVHNDIKPDNILFSDERLAATKFFRFHAERDKFLVPLGRDTDPYFYRLSDLGTAKSDQFTDVRFYGALRANARQYREGTPEWGPPETWLYYDFGNSETKQNMPPRELGSDVWSVGLMLLGKVLNGWDLKGRNVGPSRWKDIVDAGGVYIDLLPVRILFNDSAVRTQRNAMARHAVVLHKAALGHGLGVLPGGDLHVVSGKVLDNIVPTLLLLHALGNPLPQTQKADAGHAFGSLHHYLITTPALQGRQRQTRSESKRPIDVILKLGKRWRIQATEESIFDMAVARIVDRVGDDGLDFLKRCLDWSPARRTDFAQTIRAGYRGSALGHPFLARLGRKDFLYDSSEEPSRDYFLF